MSAVRAFVEQQGGYARRRDLLRVTSRAAVDRALRDGALVRVGRGRYGLPHLKDDVGVAQQLAGVLSHESAALWHGWEVKRVPEKPHVAVPRKRRVTADRRATAHVHWVDLAPEDLRGPATSVETTLLHCLRDLDEDAALAVADAALRHGTDPAVLRRIHRHVRGHGAAKVRRILERADGRAANPFESVLRHVAYSVPGLRVAPQQLIVGPNQTVRPDLVDETRRLVLEADSFEWHGGRVALARDARRYNWLIVEGWIVLRFSWEDVMFDHDYVRRVLVAAVALVDQQAQPAVS